MKRIITSFLITLNFCILYAYSPKNVFRVIDETGYEIIYNIDEDDNGEYATILAAYGTADTLIVPDSVEYKGVTYAVCGWIPMSGVVQLPEEQERTQIVGFTEIDASVVCLPKTLKYCWTQQQEGEIVMAHHSGINTQKFCVAEDNPYFVSPDGVIYTADMQTLIAFPMGLRGKYDMPEGVKRLGKYSCLAVAIDTLNLAESVEELEILSLYITENLKSFRYTDNIRTLGRNQLVSGAQLEEIVLGSGLKDLGTTASISSIEHWAFRSLYCLAPEPPELKANKVYGSLLTLFVPRASINLYEAHPAWGLFPRITAIEPPIVSGINEAEVTWVSNADATGYSWELYLDEERTVLVMRLTFARDGRLLELEFGSGFMSSSSPEPMRAAAEEADGEGAENEETTERQFTTYYSFTVKNLSPNTQYYYTRKTYGEAGEDGEPMVIDEEQSDFTTLSDTSTSLSSATDSPAVQKVLRNGSVYILNGDETYTLTGAEVK